MSTLALETISVENRPAPKNFRIALLLAAIGAISTLLVLPYALEVLPGVADTHTAVNWTLVYAAQFVQSGLMLLLVAWLGLRLGRDLGLDAPIMRRALGDGPTREITTRWRMAAILGSGVGVVCLLLLFLVPMPHIEAHTPAWWKGLLASFYGGIDEEILCRLFLVTLFVWIGARLTRTRQPGAIVYIVAIVLAAILFGAGHLPLLAQIAELKLATVVYVIGLNAFCGITFGWVFWRYGLEHAMVSHFCADLVLHVAAPLLG